MQHSRPTDMRVCLCAGEKSLGSELSRSPPPAARHEERSGCGSCVCVCFGFEPYIFPTPTTLFIHSGSSLAVRDLHRLLELAAVVHLPPACPGWRGGCERPRDCEESLHLSTASDLPLLATLIIRCTCRADDWRCGMCSLPGPRPPRCVRPPPCRLSRPRPRPRVSRLEAVCQPCVSRDKESLARGSRLGYFVDPPCPSPPQPPAHPARVSNPPYSALWCGQPPAHHAPMPTMPAC